MRYVSSRFVDIDVARQAEVEARERIREYLRDKRQALGVTQAELAFACGWASDAHVCEIEAGRRHWTRPAALLADAFLDRRNK